MGEGSLALESCLPALIYLRNQIDRRKASFQQQDQHKNTQFLAIKMFEEVYGCRRVFYHCQLLNQETLIS